MIPEQIFAKDGRLFLRPSEQRHGQYATEKIAEKMARAEIVRTGKRHRIMFTHTWRNLEFRACWMIVLGTPGRGDKFQG